MRMRLSWWLLWGAFQRNNNKKSIVVPDIRFLTNEKESLKKTTTMINISGCRWNASKKAKCKNVDHGDAIGIGDSQGVDFVD